MSTALARIAGLLATVALALLFATPALAHAVLASSTPEDGAVLDTQPTVVELRFTEGLDAAKSSFRLEGPDGLVGTGRANRDGGRVMRLGGLALGPGGYTVLMTIASADGHEIERDRITFTVSEATASTAPSTGPSEAPSTAPSSGPASPSGAASDAPASAAPTVAPSASAGPDEVPVSEPGGDVVLPIAVALALVAGVGAWVLRRSRSA